MSMLSLSVQGMCLCLYGWFSDSIPLMINSIYVTVGFVTLTVQIYRLKQFRFCFTQSLIITLVIIEICVWPRCLLLNLFMVNS